jgi:hypothetical protein
LEQTCFNGLYTQYHLALRKDFNINIPRRYGPPSPPFDHVVDHAVRKSLRERFKRILEGYQIIYEAWDPVMLAQGNAKPLTSGGEWSQHLMQGEVLGGLWCSGEARHPIIWADDFDKLSWSGTNPQQGVGLALGLSISASADEALSLHNSNPSSLICTSNTGTPDWLMFDTESHGRDDHAYPAMPELRRVRFFRPIDGNADTSRNRMRDVFSNAVNIGPLVPRLVRAIKSQPATPG